MGNCLSKKKEVISHNEEENKLISHRVDKKIIKNTSFARVASKIISVSSGGAKTIRASSYDHVNNVVETSFGKLRMQEAGVTGLHNLGNSCYMASALQCLSNTIPLTDYFLGYNFSKEINYRNALGSKGKLVKAYSALTTKIWLNEDKHISPIEFKKSIENFAPQFKGTAQHDSQELLAFLLDGIHEDLNRVQSKPYIEEKVSDGSDDEGDSVIAWQNYLKRDRSIIVDIFQGQLRSEIRCQNNKGIDSIGCGHKSVRFESFMYLSLPFSDSVNSLDDCLDLFCTEELLTGGNQWYCPKCKDHVDASKKINIWALPPILIVHLKRFKFDQFGNRSKIGKKIKYPISSWDLSNQTMSKTACKHHKFDLYAVSNHFGTAVSGHYTAYAKNRLNSNWYEFNDAACTRLNEDSSELGSSSSCYVLFYNRTEEILVKEMSGLDVDSNRSAGNPRVRRQSIDRPELWPHMQVMNRDYRSFRRSSPCDL